MGTVDGEPVFSTIAEAEEYAEKIGCSGYHTHEPRRGDGVHGLLSHVPQPTTGTAEATANTQNMERRSFTTSIEAGRSRLNNDESKIEGYASVFHGEAYLGNFTETIDKDAFVDVLQDDVRMLFNHDPNFPLAAFA